MPREHRPRSWWRQTVARWKRGGLTAAEFAEEEGVSERTLRWWSSTLRRGTRAERGSVETIALAPIEIEVPRRAATSARVEIEVGGAVVRVEVGADVEYVCELVRRLGAARTC